MGSLLSLVAGQEEVYISLKRAQPRKALSQPRVITDIYIIADESGQVEAPPGYIKYPYDLNKGSGGSFKYCSRRGTTCGRTN